MKFRIDLGSKLVTPLQKQEEERNVSVLEENEDSVIGESEQQFVKVKLCKRIEAKGRSEFLKFCESDAKLFEHFSSLDSETIPSELTFKEAAIYILSKSKQLMTAGEIVAQAIELGVLKTQGKTPGATLASRINTDINRKGEASIFVKFGLGKFSIRPKFVEHIKNSVLSPEELEMGMTLLAKSALKYIPFEDESTFLEVRESQIPGAGMGLFVKEKITVGTIFSEYKGRLLDLDLSCGDHVLHPYAVSVQGENGVPKIIDGVDEHGNVLSFAPRANDAGPIFQNAILSEFKEHPGRTFLEAKRDLLPGEEVFVIYGTKYWGIELYPTFNRIQDYAILPSLAEHGNNASNEEQEFMCTDGESIFDEEDISDSEDSEVSFLYTCTVSPNNLLKLTFNRISIETSPMEME